MELVNKHFKLIIDYFKFDIPSNEFEKSLYKIKKENELEDIHILEEIGVYIYTDLEQIELDNIYKNLSSINLPKDNLGNFYKLKKVKVYNYLPIRNCHKNSKAVCDILNYEESKERFNWLVGYMVINCKCKKSFSLSLHSLIEDNETGEYIDLTSGNKNEKYRNFLPIWKNPKKSFFNEIIKSEFTTIMLKRFFNDECITNSILYDVIKNEPYYDNIFDFIKKLNKFNKEHKNDYQL